MEEEQMPRLLTSVGKSSLEKKRIVRKHPVMVSFPIMAKTNTVVVYTVSVTGGGGLEWAL